MLTQQSGPNRSGLAPVLVAQFLSALADNALLFAAIALLKAGAAPDWHIPLLQEFFVLAYIVLAPFVGAVADLFPKGRVMMVANLCKLAGAGLMLLGAPPLAAYGVVGLGAAAYSPAKYGILGELVPAEQLVKANSWMEGSTIVAILLGVVLGGWFADRSVQLAVGFTVVAYLAAAGANLLIPKTRAARRLTSVGALLKEFVSSVRLLMADREGRFSLLGTSVFWGTGSTLRFLLVAWVPLALGALDTQTPANLSAVVAVGIALGAAAAARFVPLDQASRVLPAGVLLGVLILLLAYTTSLPIAVALLVVIGACGGFYVVPLNAMLQERGHSTVGAGSAIAVQNFVENITMLLMVGLYTGLARAGASPVATAAQFGVLVAAAISLLMWMSRKSRT